MYAVATPPDDTFHSSSPPLFSACVLLCMRQLGRSIATAPGSAAFLASRRKGVPWALFRSSRFGYLLASCCRSLPWRGQGGLQHCAAGSSTILLMGTCVPVCTCYGACLRTCNGLLHLRTTLNDILEFGCQVAAIVHRTEGYPFNCMHFGCLPGYVL